MEIYNPALLDAISNLSTNGQHVVIEAVRSVTNIMKTLTTGVNPFFAVGRNVFYDIPQAYINSKSLSKIEGIVNNPFEFAYDIFDSLVRILTNERWNKEKYLQMYRDMGGGVHASASAERNILAETKAKLMPGYLDASQPVVSTGRAIKKGYGGLQRLMSTTETLPRLPEFKRTVQNEGNTYAGRTKALYEANDITFNFSRKGEISKGLDAFIPYFNAALQGLDKFGRSVKDNPVNMVANSIVAVTVPQLMLYAINHDDPAYQQISEATKSRYYLIPRGDGVFARIVKPRESGTIFGTAIEDIMEYTKTHDPKVFNSLMEGIINNFLPPMRTIFAPINDLRANKDFADRPIIPRYMEGLSPDMQVDARTSEPAKWLGDLTGMSPKQIDYLARSYLGVIGQVGQPATTCKR